MGMPPFLDFYTLKLSLLPPGILILLMLGVWDITICFLEAMVIGEFKDAEILLMLTLIPSPLNDWSFCFTVNFVALEGELFFDWSLWAVWGLFLDIASCFFCYAAAADGGIIILWDWFSTAACMVS